MFNRELFQRWQARGVKPPEQLFNRKGDAAELYLYDAIGGDIFGGGISASSVVEHLKSVAGARTLAIHINSPGGDVFDGTAIYNELKSFPGQKTVFVDGIAASIASVIAMAGDRVVMGMGTEMMVHEAHTLSMGNAVALRKVADRLEQANANIRGIYAAKTKLPDEELTKLMSEETFLSADRAVELGFADEVTRPEPVKNEAPKQVINRLSQVDTWKLRAQLAAQK